MFIFCRRIYIFFVFISLNLFSNDQDSKQFAETVKYWAESLQFYSAPHLAANRLPVSFKRINSSNKLDTKDLGDVAFKKAVAQYVEFNKFLKDSSKRNLEEVFHLLDKTDSAEETLVLVSILYESEKIKFVPKMKRCLVRVESELRKAFYAKHPIDGYEPHIFGFSSISFDSMPFYIPKCDTVFVLTRDFWGLNFGSDQQLAKYIKKYEKVKCPVRELWVQFNRANVLETGLPDREKLQVIKERIDSLPKLNQLLAYIILSCKSISHLDDLDGEQVKVSDRQQSVFNELGKMPENKIDILITPRELLFLLSQTPKKEIEEFLLGKSSIKDPDLAELPMNNTRNFFYVVAAEYIVLNRKVVWTEEEFTKFKSSALPEVLKYILDAADL